MATVMHGRRTPAPDVIPQRLIDVTDYAGKPSFSRNGRVSTDDYVTDVVPQHRRHLSNQSYGPGAGMAGVEAGRMSEIQQHTRKRTDPMKSASDSVKTLLVSADSEPNGRGSGSYYETGSKGLSGRPTQIPVPRPSKRSHLRFCGGDPEDQRRHFQTRWQVIDGKMEFCTSRKGGSGSVEFDYEQLDRDATYHTWKRMLGTYQKLNRSSLQSDRFLTVEADAARSDRLPDVKNRAPPFANPDGPFEQRNPNIRPVHCGHLDRTLCPRKGEATSEGKLSGKGASTGAVGLRQSHLATSSLAPQPGPQPIRHLRRAEYGGAHVGDSMYSILRSPVEDRVPRGRPEAFRTEDYSNMHAQEQGSQYAPPRNQEGQPGGYHLDQGPPPASQPFEYAGGVNHQGQHPQYQSQGGNIHSMPQQQESRYASRMPEEHGGGMSQGQHQDFYHTPSAQPTY
ncbi:thioredoxin-like associated protein [Cystoisospora suis]|uniref:Thioredoxin-like associated protein n=1 Tax=Cystoisospora suis TaxID=483139 RepID=A0A2C6L471_9APIC|nr:thioredoxin-like associated protein [Cystoisospora suis]